MGIELPRNPSADETLSADRPVRTVADRSKARRKNCRFHCSACGRHFNGLAAFDLHLHRINVGKNRWGARTYDLEHSSERLELWTADGYCDLTGAEADLHPVSIWRKPLGTADVSRFEKLKLRAGF